MNYSREIDKKWQKKWEEDKLSEFNTENIDKKLYCLEMFAYPSGKTLHLGHWFNFAPADSWARMKKMQGYEVFQPMGFDAFGLPAENFAIKTGVHPQDSTRENIRIMKKQLQEMGAMFANGSSDVATCMPEYYKWTQWLFLQLYKQGLAYKKKAPVNWCDNCKTVLANEQATGGVCERCFSLVTKKSLTQWFFKITSYAEELLKGLDDLDWPEKTKKNQRNWIGKSIGHEITLKIYGKDLNIKVFTTRIDTLMGMSYCVLAPENELVKKITDSNYQDEIYKYVEDSAAKSDIERLAKDGEKTGVFTGAYAVHPLSGDLIPIWIADYVLGGYASGCVMAVPAHDERDFAFAKKYNLPIIEVIASPSRTKGEFSLPYIGKEGILINSTDTLNGLTVQEASKKFEQILGKSAAPKVNYRLRDWLVSRQRYWGAPIPIIYCPKCGVLPVREEDLPVLLPYDVEFSPSGESPLKKCDSFMNTKCHICGADAKRDPDTLDTFVCSSWYFLRYPDANNSSRPFDSQFINKMLPVDKYVGGPEHAVMHLLYSRFITKALRDASEINFDEPFLSLVHQGLILGPDGTKMSKTKGNTISPDDYVEKYGSDVFRLHLMFAFSYLDGGAWSDKGIKAILRFVSRVQECTENAINSKSTSYDKNGDICNLDESLEYKLYSTVKELTKDAEEFQFNTVVAKLMELLNEICAYEKSSNKNTELYQKTVETFIKLMAPFAPHFAEEMWEKLGNKESIFRSKWPEHKKVSKKEVEIVVQINSKVRHKIVVPNGFDEELLKENVLKDEKICEIIKDKKIKKIFVVPNKLVNIVV
ncbi:MAG: leucine--tRNA ligase [Oscillospiraceae bacterium]|nr:leucine--tRNA ligase [Oscillospiraceae bacterium]